MTPLGGILFRGATLTERDDHAAGGGLLGHPVWVRGALLADLELRLGLATPDAPHAIRLQQWSQHLARVATRGSRFYSASYGIDPVGTSGALLAWRDLLVDAGWDGEPIPEGGPRLDCFVELEQEGELLPGTADRLRRVESELLATRICPWEGIELAEPVEAWPGRWQRLFALLERHGTSVRAAVPTLVGAPNASAATDLGRLQASLRGEATSSGFQGDGSVVLLTGETSWELAHATASTLRHWHEGSSVVVRGADPFPLASAMAGQGLACQGVDSESAWRPALQLLPLTLELAFTPRDPYRVLELVTLPTGPFAGWVGLQLARALSSAPGVGGRPWQSAKQFIAERLEEWSLREAATQDESAVSAAKALATERLKQVEEWLEKPGHDPLLGAPIPALLEVAERVAAFLQKRLLRSLQLAEADSEVLKHDVLVHQAALSQVQAFQEALGHDVRQRLDLVAVRQLLEEVSTGPVALCLSTEEVGRLDVVDSPAGLRCGRDLVVWWHCVNGTQGAPQLDPWRMAERRALQAVGVKLRDATAVLAAEVAGWRGVVLSAQRRLVLVSPGTSQGERIDPHPIIDELVARVQASSADIARITLSARELLLGTCELTKKLPPIRTQVLAPLSLPPARVSWAVNAELLSGVRYYSATSLETLLGCPLRWVLSQHAGLRAGWDVSIPSGPRLNGQLGHRLIEELHLIGALGEPERARAAAEQVLERLLEQEAAVLLRPGMTFELFQLRRQLVNAVVRLAELIQQSRLTVAGVEVKASADWAGRKLEGRIDLLLTDVDGREVILDLKWGRTSCEKKLVAGLALQLAVYAGARQIERSAPALPVAAYFSLTRGDLLTTERGPFADARTINGPTLAATWTKLEATLTTVENLLGRGTVPATGLVKSLLLMDSAGIEPGEHWRHVQPEPPCGYCEHASLCGRAWEQLS